MRIRPISTIQRCCAIDGFSSRRSSRHAFEVVGRRAGRHPEDGDPSVVGSPVNERIAKLEIQRDEASVLARCGSEDFGVRC